MSKIKNLAEELRQKMTIPDERLAKEKKAVSPGDDQLNLQLIKKLKVLEDFKVKGDQKMVIRIDEKSHMLLWQLKVTANIDMAKVVVYALSEFLKSSPWIREYIREHLNQNEL